MSRYPAQWLRFLAVHSQELSDDGRMPEWMRDEYQALPPGRICTCGSRTDRDRVRTGGGGPGPRMPGSDWLDLVRAVGALPPTWRARTRAELLLDGHTEEQVYEMERSGRFDSIHQGRVAASQRVAPDVDTTPEPRSAYPWQAMARYLNRSDAQAA